MDKRIVTWGSNISGEAGVIGGSSISRAVTLPSGQIPVSINLGIDPNTGLLTVSAVTASSSSGGRTLYAWGANRYDVISGTGTVGPIVPQPRAVVYDTASEIWTKKIASVTGSLDFMTIFTVAGEAYSYPIVIGNVVDTHTQFSPSDPVVDIISPAFGGIWAGITPLGKLFVAASNEMRFLPALKAINPTPMPLPPRVAVRLVAMDWTDYGMSPYNWLAIAGNDSVLYIAGDLPLNSSLSPMSFMSGRNTTHLVGAGNALIAIENSRNIFINDFGNRMLPSGGTLAVNMTGVPTSIRWTKVQFSCNAQPNSGGSALNFLLLHLSLRLTFLFLVMIGCVCKARQCSCWTTMAPCGCWVTPPRSGATTRLGATHLCQPDSPLQQTRGFPQLILELLDMACSRSTAPEQSTAPLTVPT